MFYDVFRKMQIYVAACPEKFPELTEEEFHQIFFSRQEIDQEDLSPDLLSCQQKSACEGCEGRHGHKSEASNHRIKDLCGNIFIV